MGFQPHAAPLPPHRKWYVVAMEPHRRLTCLLSEELEHLMETRGGRDASVIRSFLGKYKSLVANGNVMAAELSVGKGRGSSAAVYIYSLGAGVIRWVPALVVPMSTRIDRIMRECGLDRLFPFGVEPNRNAWGEVEPRKPPIVDKVAVQMVSFR